MLQALTKRRSAPDVPAVPLTFWPLSLQRPELGERCVVRHGDRDPAQVIRLSQLHLRVARQLGKELSRGAMVAMDQA